MFSESNENGIKSGQFTVKSKYEAEKPSSKKIFKSHKLPVFHSISVAFAGITAVLAERMKTVMTPNRLGDYSPVAFVLLLELLKVSGDSDKVFEGVAMLLLPFFVSRDPATSLIIRLTSLDNDDSMPLVP